MQCFSFNTLSTQQQQQTPFYSQEGDGLQCFDAVGLAAGRASGL